jgi:hypothetical protein
MANILAPDGKWFVCQACGKRSRDRYGDRAIDAGWDESCMMNCALANESDCIVINGRVRQVNGEAQDESGCEVVK